MQPFRLFGTILRSYGCLQKFYPSTKKYPPKKSRKEFLVVLNLLVQDIPDRKIEKRIGAEKINK
jgi:hypothetical protein